MSEDDLNNDFPPGDPNFSDRGAPERHASSADGDAGGRDRPKRSLLNRILRRVAVVLAAGIGLIVILLLLLVLALQTNWGGTHFADFLLTLGNPFSESQTEYDELRGNFITRLEMRDLRLYRLDTVYVDTIDADQQVARHVPKDSIFSESEYAAFDTFYVDTLNLARIDTFRMRYNLLALLTRTVDLREVYFANPDLSMRQRPDSTWDLLEPFGPTDTLEAGPRFTVKVERLNITDGALSATYYPPDRDSVLRINDFNILAEDWVIGDELRGRLDTLHAEYRPPGLDYWTAVRGGGAIDDDDVDITGFIFESPNSLVSAAGSLKLPSEEREEIEDIDFRIEADPIAFRDINVFIPALNAERSATLDAQVDGSTRRMNIDVDGRLSDGGVLTVNGAISAQQDGPLAYQLEAEIAGINPAFFTTPPAQEPSTVLSGGLEVDLAGMRAEELSGSIDGRLTRSTVAGLQLDEAVLTGTVDEGEADVDLRTTWNGSTITAGGIVRPFDDVPFYDLSGRTQHFNIQSVAGPGQQSDLNTGFEIRGYGFDAQTLELEAAITMGPSTINNARIDDGRVNLDMEGGELTYGVRFLFPEGLLVANGDASLNEPVRYRVQRGRFENVDLAALMGQDEASSVNGTFTLQGVGLDPQTITLEALLDMEPSTFGQYELADATARVDLRSGVLDAVVQAEMVNAGSADFAVVTRPFDDLPTLHITRGEFRNVDIGAFLDDSEQESDLSGTAIFTMRGFEVESMVLDGTFTLARSRINEQEINSARVSLDLNRGSVAYDASIVLPDGSAEFVGAAQPFLAAPTYSVTDGRFDNINLAAFTGNPSLESSLNGTLSAAATGTDPETMALDGRIDFTASRINEQDITSAFIAGEFIAGTLDAEMQLDAPEGQTRFTATVRPFLDVPTYTIHEGSFGGINVAAITGNPDFQTNLTGNLSLTGEGFDPETMTAEGSIELSPSTVNQEAVTSGSINASIQDARVVFEADLNFEDGSANLQGGGLFFADVPQYDVEGALRNVEIGNLIGSDTLRTRVSVDFDVEGTGTDPETMELQGRITSNDITYEGASLDTLYSAFQLSEGILTVDSLQIRSTAVDAVGSGVIAAFDTTAASDFDFVADLKDLQPLQGFIQAENFSVSEGRFEGSVYGRAGTLQFDAMGNIQNLRYNDIRLARFDGTLAGELGPDRSLRIAELDGDLAALSLPQFLVDAARLEVQYEADQVAFRGEFTIDARRSAQVAGRVDMTPGVERATVETLTLDMEDHQWELLQEASVTYGEEYRVSNLLLYSGNQQIAIDGVVDPDGEQNLVLTIEEFVMDDFADLLGYEGLGGVLNGFLLLSGPAEAPEMSGTLNADLASFEEGVGDLQLAVDYQELRLNLDALLTHDDGSTLTAEGFIPFDLRLQQLEEDGLSSEIADRSVEFSIDADSFSVGWIDPFLDPETITEFDGKLSGSVDVGGTLDTPVLDGDATYIDGAVGLAVTELVYRDIRAQLAFQDNQVQISDLYIRSEDGTVSGEGSINLAELTLGEFDINFRADNFLAVDSREYYAVTDGQMHLTGTTSMPELEGSLQIINSDIYFTEQTTAPELETVELSQEDLQTVEQRFGLRVTEADTTTFDFFDALAMNMSVQIGRNTWIRSTVNPVMDIQFSGSLDILKDHYEDMEVFGTIDVVEQRSRIVQFGKRFNITSGTITFNGPVGDPLVDISAEYDIRTLRGSTEDVTITLSVSGRMSEQLDLTLGSNPDMAYADIVSYIATGQPASASLQLGGIGGTGADLAVGQLTSLVEGIAGSQLGLDVVTIEQTGGTPTVTAGKYVTSRLFVSVSQPIGDASNNTRGSTYYNENAPVVTVEYEVQNWLLLRLLQRSSIVRMNVLVEYSY